MWHSFFSILFNFVVVVVVTFHIPLMIDRFEHWSPISCVVAHLCAYLWSTTCSTMNEAKRNLLNRISQKHFVGQFDLFLMHNQFRNIMAAIVASLGIDQQQKNGGRSILTCHHLSCFQQNSHALGEGRLNSMWKREREREKKIGVELGITILTASHRMKNTLFIGVCYKPAILPFAVLGGGLVVTACNGLFINMYEQCRYAILFILFLSVL